MISLNNDGTTDTTGPVYRVIGYSKISGKVIIEKVDPTVTLPRNVNVYVNEEKTQENQKEK